MLNNIYLELSKQSNIDISLRKEYLIKLNNIISKYEKEIINALKLDLNKAELESLMTELYLIYDELHYFIKNINKLTKYKKVKSSILQFKSTAYTYYEPYGLVLIISPWNYPFLLTLQPLIGAIASGNRVLIKPSEYSINSAKVLEKIILECFEHKYVDIILGDSSVSKSLLLKKFDYIFFTGSTKVGKLVYQSASNNLTKVTLELGGKSPVIINDGKKLDLVCKRLLFGKFTNAGQTCVAPDYAFIKDDLYDVFIKTLFDELKEVELDIKNNLYPKIINEKHFKRLLSLISDEKVIYKSIIDEKNLIIGPQVILEDDLTSDLMTEEIFGPLIVLVKYHDLNDAITYINNQEKPLALYIFSDNKNIINKIINTTSSGSVLVNDTIVQLSVKNLPFGGVGASGIGAYHGKESMACFSHQKSILKRSKLIDIKLRYNKNKKNTKLFKSLLNLLTFRVDNK